MSFDNMLTKLVADEVQRALAPIHAALAQLKGQGAVIERLSAALGSPIKVSRSRATKTRGGRRAAAEGNRACAVIDCGRDARSKGFCSAHYQKYCMLERTGRLPSDWKPDAEPGSVKNIALPRGRAGAKSLRETKNGK